MISKKMKVLLSVFTALVLMAGVTFATDDVATQEATEPTQEVTTENPTTEGSTNEENAEPSVTSIAPDATDETATDGTTAQQPETIRGDLFRDGDNVTISELVDGNVFVKAGSLTVTGQIAGDLFVIANTINIDGAQISGNLFAVANEITLNGLVFDFYGVCNTLQVPYAGTAYRNLKVVCNNITMNGMVGANAEVVANQSITLESDCQINGNLNYTTPNELTDIKEGAIAGEVNFTQSSVANAPFTFNSDVASYVWSLVFTIIFALFVWVIVTFVTPNFKEKLVKAGNQRPIASFLFGLLGIIIVPIVSVALLLTIIGIPVSVSLLVLYAMFLICSCAFASISLANILANKVEFFKKWKQFLAVLVVVVVIWLLELIPFVGGIVTILAALYGFGASVLALFNKVEKKAKK